MKDRPGGHMAGRLTKWRDLGQKYEVVSGPVKAGAENVQARKDRPVGGGRPTVESE
jgi:hypothetical protein